MKNVYLDTETTGLNPGQIGQLTVIIEDTDLNKVETKNYFFEVSEMEEGAQKIHGFSIEDLRSLSGGKKFADYKDELLSIFNNATLIAHNLPFDEKFISSEFWRTGISFKPFGRYDTMQYFTNIVKIPSRSRFSKGGYKFPKLSEVGSFFNVNIDKVKEYTNRLFCGSDKEQGFHDARFDTTLMYVCVNLERERLNGGNSWHNMFCN
ncbi:MAG: 3'-5' exonuclease [Lachnospiraceae bacterium]|nr:3'-5' exonuclease [Lachnospiraceae bacterium]